MTEDPHIVVEGRHGRFIVNKFDHYIGGSLIHYGEYCPSESQLLCELTPIGGCVVEVGANYGTLTVPLANRVGPKGKIVAFEPQRTVYHALCGTLALNLIQHVDAYQAAVGAAKGEIQIPLTRFDNMQTRHESGMMLNSGSYRVRQAHDNERKDSCMVYTLDRWTYSRLDLIKIDVEGMECDVLRGAQKTIEAHNPLIYTENAEPKTSPELITLLESIGYDCYWHASQLFSHDNFFNNSTNIFGTATSLNMICFPSHKNNFITGLKRAQANDRHPFDRT